MLQEYLGDSVRPTFVLLFIDICRGISVTIKLFADCVLYNKIETAQDQINQNHNLLKIELWCNEWQMVLNAQKLVFISIMRNSIKL